MREGYLRHHPHTPARPALQASLRGRWPAAGSPLDDQLRPRPEAARGGWIHSLVLLGTARAVSH